MTSNASYRSMGLALALAAAASAGHAQPVATAPLTGSFVVVANQRSGVATLIDIASGRAIDVDLGGNPHEVAVSPDSRFAALTIPSELVGSSRRILVLDLATAKVLRAIDLGDYRGPHGIAFVSDSVALVGTLAGTSAIYVDVRNGRVLRAIDGLPANPYVIALTATGRAYVSSPRSGKVTEIDVAAGTRMRTIDIPDDPAGIAVSADGKELYAAVWRDKVGGGIAIFDLTTGAVTAKLPATQPRRMTVTADGKLLVVTDGSVLRLIERASRRERTLALGQRAGGSGVACAPDSRRCYVTLSRAGEVLEVDVAAARVLRRFAARRGVDGVAYVAR